jgi:hypothetical protein
MEKNNTEQFKYLWLCTLLPSIKLPMACFSDSEHLAISTFSTPWAARSLKVKKTASFL